MRRILLVSSDLALAVHLGAVGEGAFTLDRAGEADLPLALAGASLLLVDGQDPETMIRVMQIVRGAAPGLPMIALGDVRRADVVLAAVRGGAADFLDREDFGTDFLDRLEQHLRTAATERGNGRLDIVLSVEQGGGETGFAVNLALLLAESHGDVVLFDCGAGQGDLAQALDLKPAYGFAEAARDWDRLDRTLLTSAVAHHKASGLHLLPLAADLEARPLSPEAVDRVIGATRPLFRDAVLCASGLDDSRLVRSLIEQADRLYLLCPQRIAALGRGQRLLRSLTLGKGLLQRTTLVIDGWSPDILLSEEQMRLALGLERSARLPESRIELINAANAARPLALSQPKSPYVLALARLAGLEREAAPPAVRMLERMLEAMKRASRAAQPIQSTQPVQSPQPGARAEAAA